MKLWGVVWMFVGSCVLMSAQASADYCPKRIAVIQNTVALKAIEQIIHNIYEELHCDTRFMPMPAKRGVLTFNNAAVDGELVRLQAIETLYKREVVRSDPLAPAVLGLWGRKNNPGKVLGHVRGIAWQDGSIGGFVKEGWRTRAFNKHEQMYAAYLRGLIDHFLSIDIFTVEFFARRDKDSVIQKEILLAPQGYHYLSAEYADFMRDFNRYVRNNDPFKELKK